VKVFISIDLEGISGVCRPEQTKHGSDEWQAARGLMRDDLDAVLEGCFEGGADEVVVCDAHDFGDNLGVAGLPAAVQLISGSDPDLSMMAGIETGVDVAMFVGYHAKAGTAAATLAHTWMDELARVEVTGAPDGELETGELGTNAAAAGAFGVPVVFASGDDKFVAEARAFVPGIEAVAVKDGLAWGAARLLAPGPAHAALRAAAARALTAPRPQPLDWNGRGLRVTFARPDLCDGPAGCPGVARLDGTTIEIPPADWLTVFRTFIACTHLVL
jgi:D-amino peptidase